MAINLEQFSKTVLNLCKLNGIKIGSSSIDKHGAIITINSDNIAEVISVVHRIGMVKLRSSGNINVFTKDGANLIIELQTVKAVKRVKVYIEAA